MLNFHRCWWAYVVMGPGEIFLTQAGSGSLSHFWFGLGFGKFPLKNQIFPFFSFLVKKSLRVGSKSTRVKGGSASYLQQVKSVFGSVWEQFLHPGRPEHQWCLFPTKIWVECPQIKDPSILNSLFFIIDPTICDDKLQSFINKRLRDTELLIDNNWSLSKVFVHKLIYWNHHKHVQLFHERHTCGTHYGLLYQVTMKYSSESGASGGVENRGGNCVRRRRAKYTSEDLPNKEKKQYWIVY